MAPSNRDPSRRVIVSLVESLECDEGGTLRAKVLFVPVALVAANC